MTIGRGSRAREGRREEDPELVAAAREAAGQAYAPYSGFVVGVALRDIAGRVFRGFNIENAAHPLGICAERVALLDWRMLQGADIVRIVIHTHTAVPTSPCGLCRDALLRWAPSAQVFLSCRRRVRGPVPVADWLPAGACERDR